MSTAAAHHVAREVFSPATFTVRNLSVLAYAQGFTLWHYKAPGMSLTEASAPGFFNHAADLLAVGDMVLISAADGGSAKFVAKSEPNGVILAGVV